MKYFTIFIISLFGLGCATMPVGVRTYDAEFGSNVVFDKDKKIALTDILEDSRCPIDAECMWAGEAVLQFRVINGLIDTQYINVTFDNASMESDELELLDIYNLQILELDPQREMNVSLNDEEYRARILIEKFERK